MDNRPTVYFTDLRTSPGNSLPQKLQKLVRRAGIGQIAAYRTDRYLRQLGYLPDGGFSIFLCHPQHLRKK